MTQRCPICERCLTDGGMTARNEHKSDRSVQRLELEPKTRDTWYQPEKKLTRPAPFLCGGE